MKLKKRYWAAAFIFSLAVHAGAAAMLMRDGGDEVLIAGGDQFEIALLGNAFQNSVLAGEERATVEPVEQPSETAEQPIEQPLTPRPTAEPVLQSAETAMQSVTPDQPVQLAPSPATEAPVAQPVAPGTVEQIEMEEMIAALVHVPVPTARPAQAAEAVQPVAREQKPVDPVKETAKPAEPRKREPQREQMQRKQEKAPPKRQAAGNGGNAQADARKGEADGDKGGSQAVAGRSGTSREAGNAAVSNYPGKVVSKLRRSLRYPSAARRDRLRGEVHVAFTVTGGGGVSGARVVRSSGSSVLDQAALETVRRAAPFPPIPDGRANWSFTVPLAFTR